MKYLILMLVAIIVFLSTPAGSASVITWIGRESVVRGVQPKPDPMLDKVQSIACRRVLPALTEWRCGMFLRLDIRNMSPSEFVSRRLDDKLSAPVDEYLTEVQYLSGTDAFTMAALLDSSILKDLKVSINDVFDLHFSRSVKYPDKTFFQYSRIVTGSENDFMEADKNGNVLRPLKRETK